MHPWDGVRIATYCPLARTRAAGLGTYVARGPLAAPVLCCPGARGRLWGLGWVAWGLRGQRGEAESLGTAIYKLAFAFGRLPSPSPPSAGWKKAPLSWRQMGRGRALAHAMGRIMCPDTGGPAAGHPAGAAAASACVATSQQGLWGQEQGSRGSWPRSFVTPANATTLVPWLPGGTSLPCAPGHPASPAHCGVAEQHAPPARGGRRSQHGGGGPASPPEVFVLALSAGLGAPPGRLIWSHCKKAQ